MEFVHVANTNELSVGKMIKVKVHGTDVLIVNVEGALCALNNRCPHAGGSLADGALNGSVVTCPKHGAQFDVKTGEVVGKAKVMFLQMKPGDAARYEIKIEGTDVLVGIA